MNCLLNGRTKIWTRYLEYIESDSLINTIFGRGYIAAKHSPSIKNYGLGWAHNDFIQVYFDYGVVGLVLFVGIIFRLIRKYFLMYKREYEYSNQFLTSLVVFLTCSSLSMVTILPQWFLPMAAFWGAVTGDFDRRRRK